MKILIGKTSEEQVIELKLEIDEMFSISGTEYDFSDVFDSDTGENRARDILEDGELWKMAVETDRTTSSLEDWVDEVIRIDGWEDTLGDIVEIEDDKFCRVSSFGQIDMHNEFTDWSIRAIPQEDINLIK